VSEHVNVVDGIRLPAAQYSGHPALDFCNTYAGWDGLDDYDFLGGYDALAVWAGAAGLLTAPHVAELRLEAKRSPRRAAAALADARTSRCELYSVLTGAAAPDALNRLLPRTLPHLRMAASGLVVDRSSGLRAPVFAAVWSAAQLLTSPEREMVRACPGRGCGWLFLDRRGRRRWCSMATCGNREKARRCAPRRLIGSPAILVAMEQRNVLGGPLEPCSTDPLTGFYRDGCCHFGIEDIGRHTICAVVTEEFLGHQQSIGNDLTTPIPQYGFPGLIPGDRWCVTAINWLRAHEDGAATFVVLASTNERTLDVIPLDVLRQYAVDVPADPGSLA
jgi:uncharacterized protein (DUF2237 family)/predicted RNA-binding Zn ribbon-like protein